MQQSGHREIDCKTCWNGYRNFRHIRWTQDQHPLEVTKKSSRATRPSLPSNKSLEKHNLFTNFPKDPNCEICTRTKITSVPCRRNPKSHIHRATKFGDIITADHQIFRRRMELETGANRQRSSTILQAQQSRSPSSAGTPTRGTNGSTTVGSRTTTPC